MEIDEISDELKQLQRKQVMDLTELNTDGYLEMHATRLLKNFHDLINKINNDMPSKNDWMAAEAKRVFGKETK